MKSTREKKNEGGRKVGRRASQQQPDTCLLHPLVVVRALMRRQITIPKRKKEKEGNKMEIQNGSSLCNKVCASSTVTLVGIRIRTELGEGAPDSYRSGFDTGRGETKLLLRRFGGVSYAFSVDFVSVWYQDSPVRLNGSSVTPLPISLSG